jgi:hypothetical protein
MHTSNLFAKITVLFLVVFCGFYLVKVLPVSPIYIFFCLALFSFFIFLFVFEGVVCIKLYKLYIFLSSFILLSITTLMNSFEFSGLLVGMYVTFMSLCIILFLADNFTKNFFIKVSSYHITFSLCLLTIEALYRITHPDFEHFDDIEEADSKGILFYIYKFSSLMYPDSNFVAIQIICLLFFMKEYSLLIKSKMHIQLILCWILLFASFSRSAIFSAVFCWILFYSSRFIKSSVIFVAICSLIYMGVDIVLESDGSLLTKFEIFTDFYDYLFYRLDGVSTFFWGSGFNSSSEKLMVGRSAHSLLLTLLIELGLIVTVLYFSIIFVLCMQYKRSMYIFLPLFISSFAFSPINIPYFFVYLVLLIFLRNGVIEGVSNSLHREIKVK